MPKSSRLALVTALPLLALACAGAQRPPRQAGDGEPALETTSASVDMADPSARTPARGAPTPGAAVAAPAADAPTPAPAAAQFLEPLPPPSGGPTTLKGKLAGGAFAPKVALLNDVTVGRDDVVITIVDRDVTCAQAALLDGDKNVQVRVPWKAGRYDVSAKTLGLKFGVQRKNKNLLGDAQKGAVEVLAAPRQEGQLGRIRIKGSAPKESVEGEIDVRLCMSLR